MGNVSVDERFVRFGNKSYAINKITSVDVRSTTVSGSKAYKGWWALAALLGLFCIQTPEMILAPVLFAFLGWRSWKSYKDTVTHRLYLMTAAGEAQAFQTNDDDEIIGLRDAIEDSMAKSH